MHLVIDPGWLATADLVLLFIWLVIQLVTWALARLR